MYRTQLLVVRPWLAAWACAQARSSGSRYTLSLGLLVGTVPTNLAQLAAGTRVGT